ncbi:MAG: Zn-ribbon domain-containing OB-fold protein [Candidatus Aenigmarchaeota archaeon]|nr:Zn-ribbon domain-containing OB-fold protein [Candidatus Aenigmarchaeota archaeon]
MMQSIPIFWRLNKSKYSLTGSRCSACNLTYFPPRMLCQKCGRTCLDEVSLPETGKIISHTTIYVAPEGFNAPYTIAVIDLGEVLFTSHVVGDISKIKNNTRVKAVFRKINEHEDGLINYGLKFELIEE